MAPVSVSPEWLRSRYRAALLVLAVIAAMSIALAAWLADAAGWVSHSRDVLRVARDAHVQLLLGEAAIRGSLLNNDTTFWRDTDRSHAAMVRALDSLETLTRDNAVQTQRAQAVVETVERWWSDYAMRTARRTDADAATAGADERRAVLVRRGAGSI